MAKRSTHYINNAEFYDALKTYLTARKKAKSKSQELPPIPEYIGECFLKIATNLAHKPNFASYTFKDDMISDGIENCFHRDTPILTMEYGPIAIGNIVGRVVTVKARDGHWRPATVKSYGTQRLYRYQFGSFNTPASILPHEVVATSNHRWFVANRVNSQRSFTGEHGPITDLRLGDVLEPATTCEQPDAEGVLHGLIFGDGSINQKTVTYADTTVVLQGKEYPFIRVCKQDKVREEICQILKDIPHTFPKSANGDPVYYLGRRHGLKELPHGYDPAYVRGFIYGWWLADGLKTNSARRLQISTINAAAVAWIRKYAAYGGYCLISVRKTSRPNTGFPNAKPLYTITLAESEKYHARVRNITYVGEDEVFCVEEPVTQGFVLANGLLTGNCLTYLHNFNPKKTHNPFGYFTQIIYFAFIRRIQREKKHTYIKYKLMEKLEIDGGAHIDTNVTDGEAVTTSSKMLKFDNVQDFISRYENYTAGRRERRRTAKTKK